MTKARIFIVDDHPLVREGLTVRISAQRDMEVCGEAVEVDAALAQLEVVEPDLVILDLALRDSNGLTLIKKLSQKAAPPKILVLSAHDERVFAERVLRAGAQGYVNKQEAQGKVLDAIRAVLRGERYVSADVMQRLVGRAVGDKRTGGGIESLSNRELEIFDLIGPRHGHARDRAAAALERSHHRNASREYSCKAGAPQRHGAHFASRSMDARGAMSS